MTDEINSSVDDPFDENDYDPGVGLAAGVVESIDDFLAVIRAARDEALAANPDAKNSVAKTARKLVEREIEKIVVLRDECVRIKAAASKNDQTAAAQILSIYSKVYGLFYSTKPIVEKIRKPDRVPHAPPLPPLPVPRSWAATAAAVEADTLAWGARVRGKKGQLLILKPSASAGKTEAAITLAIREQQHRQRIVFTVFTKEMANGELKERIEKRGHFIRLRVIQGRDEDTCRKYDNVKAVQEHGYAPGRAVCFSCEHHPKEAWLTNLGTCVYYQSRVDAQRDVEAARRGQHEYPIILSTHSGFVSATGESGGGRFGDFWPSDLLIMDEDPTAAFEPTTTIEPQHAEFAHPTHPEATALAALVKAAMKRADADRKTWAGSNWKKNGEKSPIHDAHGSVYAARDLTDLFDDVADSSFRRFYNVTGAEQVFAAVADKKVQPDVGGLWEMKDAKTINKVIPPASFQKAGAMMHQEIALHRLRRVMDHKEARAGNDLSVNLTAAEIEQELSIVETTDFSYSARLEYAPKEKTWRFVIQEVEPLRDHATNIIASDAFGSEDHYRLLLDKPKKRQHDPAYTDPVTIVDHIACFPPGSRLLRVRTPAGIGYVKDKGWQDHAALLADYLSTFKDGRVLIYGHSELEEKFNELRRIHNDFGIATLAFEHWWGGRGKDQYKDFDAVVLISEARMNITGMLHIVNARAAHDAQRKLALNDVEGARDDMERIGWKEIHSDMSDHIKEEHMHWRLWQEHERQNINEQAQALHRVRPLINPKTMIVFGTTIPLTRDTIAASSTSVPDGRPIIKRAYATQMSYITDDEIQKAMEAIEDHFGFWSPALGHVFLNENTVRALGHGVPVAQSGYQVVGLKKGSLILSPTTCSGNPPNPPNLPTIVPDSQQNSIRQTNAGGPRFVPGAHQPMPGLLERVWEPPPRWTALNAMVVNANAFRRAKERFVKMIADHGGSADTYRPSWWPPSQGRVGYEWYSLRPGPIALKAFKTIMDDQYGPLTPSGLLVPRRTSWNPFLSACAPA